MTEFGSDEMKRIYATAVAAVKEHEENSIVTKLREWKPKPYPAHGSGLVLLFSDEAQNLMLNAADEIARLQRDCAELYQVIGAMAEHCPDPDATQIVKALDNASDAANESPRTHDDLLPFFIPGARR